MITALTILLAWVSLSLLFMAYLAAVFKPQNYRALVLFGLLFLVFAFVPGLAWSQGHDEGHAQYHEAYQHWRIPGTDASCCQAKKVENGMVTGDCYPTVAELHPGPNGPVWWALRDNGEWVEIPERALIREKNPDATGRAAHLCYNEHTLSVLCFKPPVGSF